MKKLLLPLLIFVGCYSIQANETNKKSNLKTLLTEVNKYWQYEVPSETNIQGLKLPKSEKEKIRLHLKLVHQKLSQKEVKHLSAIQKENRSKTLQTLESYYKEGRFPINLHHSYRIPYFIDDYGTACAVGHLIIESGHQKIAQRIAKKNNYAYIEEMNYPEIEKWASDYGFTVEELKWIQPTYFPYCAPGTHKDPECHDGPGCINPDFAADSLIPPYSVTYEYNDGSGWVIDSVGYIHMYGARIGQHRVTCIDSLNNTRVYNYTINNIPDINVQANITHQTDTNNCNASLSVQTSVDPPYQLDLMRNNPTQYYTDSNGHFSNLCAGNYTIIVYDSNFCQKTEVIQIYNLATSLEEKVLSSMNLAPNPFKNNFKVSFDSPVPFQYQIYNLSGQLIQEGKAISNEQIDFKSDNSGIYFLEVRQGNQRYTEKIVKAQ